MIVHRTRCQDCDDVQEYTWCEADRYPPCESCGGTLQWVPAGLHTDVYGCAKYSDATGQYHTSQRDKDRVMKEAGYEPCGDKVHGARPEHRIKNTGFSYRGQPSRTSAREREARHKPIAN